MQNFSVIYSFIVKEFIKASLSVLYIYICICIKIEYFYKQSYIDQKESWSRKIYKIF